MKETILKVFGTGQVTIPKKWRELFNTDTFKAVLDVKNRKIDIKPVKTIELDDFTPMTSTDFKRELKEKNFSDEFIEDVVAGFKESSMCLDKASTTFDKAKVVLDK